MNNQKEVWLPVKGYEGLYEVSNQGGVRSLDRLDSMGRSIKGVDKKPTLGTGGYYYVMLSNLGKRKFPLVHQLVAMAFLNHKPCGFKTVINHIDFNKQNNRVENLELTTNRENCNLKHIKSVSKYVGVTTSGGKWIARIYANGERIYLGTFDKEYDAHLAYQKALSEL